MARNSTPSKTKEEVPEEKPELLFGQPVIDLSNEEIDDLAAQEDSFDIFIDVGDKLRKSGDRVTYTLKKDGAFLAGSIPHPYSWDKIHKKWGGGTYTVVARSAQKNGFIKQQSRFLSDESIEDEALASAISPTTANSPVEMLALLQSMKADERAESREREERAETARREREERLEKENDRRLQDQKDSGNTMMTMMTMLMKSQSESQATMMAAMMGSRKDEMRPEKLVELMDSRMEKMVDRLTGKNKQNEMNPQQLIHDLADAEERGYRRAMDLQTLAEKKAEELAEMRGNGAPVKEETSTTQQLINAVMPVAQAILAAKMSAPATPSVQVPLGRAPAISAQRPAQPPRIVGQPAPRPVMVQPSKPITVKSTPAPVQQQGKVTISNNAGSAIIQARPQTAGIVTAPYVSVPVQQPTPTIQVAAKLTEPTKPEMIEMTPKQLIEKIVIDEITKDLIPNLITQKFNPEGTADRCITLLKPFQVSPGLLCSEFTLNDMISVAKARGMPASINAYLEKFYGRVKAVAAMDAGNHAPSS